MPKPSVERRRKMLYLQQFQQIRSNETKNHRSSHSAVDPKFFICSNEYVHKLQDHSRPVTRAATPYVTRERPQTVVVVTRAPSISTSSTPTNSDLSVLNIRATSWNPQQSRITRENKDYMTALAKGLTRDDNKSFVNEHGEVFSSRWHQHLNNSVYRPGTAKPLSARGHRPPTSGVERRKGSISTLIEVNRPTTAPVVVQGGGARRTLGNKAKSAAPTRPPPPRAPPAPLRATRSIDSSGNFDNLTSASFLHLADGLKPSIFKADNHFVHQLCSNATADNTTEILNTSRDSFLDLSNGTLLVDTPNATLDKDDHDQQQPQQQSAESTEDELEDNKNDVAATANDIGHWNRNAKSGRIEARLNAVDRRTPREDPQTIERRMIQQEEDALRQRQLEIDQYNFDLPVDLNPPPYEFKDPFSEEYDQAIALQTQLSTSNGSNEWSLKDFYRDVKTPFEHRTNTKAVFEKCLKLARLQASTIKWEQRRRQTMSSYNRLLKSMALDNTSSNLNGSLSSKNTSANDKETRELNELKRELRCNECKRLTCLGNCAPGQDYHLYKRLVSTISSQVSASSSRQPSLVSGTSGSSHRCKHGCTTCSATHSRSNADIINANAIITSLNSNNISSNTSNTAIPHRLRSSKTTFSFGQKAQRPAVDLRPRSMHQVTREMKMKFEQANLSPVVVVPLFEDESHSMLTKHGRYRPSNGLLPGKSFRSQRRDSLTLLSPQKVLS